MEGPYVSSRPSVTVTKTSNQMSTGFAVHILRIKTCFSMVYSHISTIHIYIFQNGISYAFYYHLSFAWKCSLIRPIGFVVHQLSILPVASQKENDLCMRLLTLQGFSVIYLLIYKRPNLHVCYCCAREIYFSW